MDGTDVREQEAQVNGAEDEQNMTAQAEATQNEVDFDEELDGAALMEQFLSDPTHDYTALKYGDVMDGIITRIDRDELLVDIGSKAEGIVPTKEYSSLSAEEKEQLNVGDTILVFVVQPENPEGYPVVSIDRARQEKSWRRLQELHEANEIIEAEVTNYNKGGLLVNLDGVRGFVPASQVSEIRGGDESSKQADMARLIGSSLPLKVIEINRHRNRLILSERQAVQERRDEMKEQLIQELHEGEVRKGRVSSICDFGAFVDIGGADGLVHLSELSWSRVRHPSEVLKVGEEVDVYVLGINASEKKIALSIKRTQPEPWSRVADSYEVGQLVKGTVTQLANFGAFARIEDGIEGLIHVSELADERIQHPKQVVQESQELILRIIRIDPQRRRMGLSLRRALDTPDAELQEVFGEEILEERDALAQRVRASLDAEGLTGTTQQEPAAASAEGAAPAPIDSEAAAQSAGEAQVAAFKERSRRAEEAAQRRQQRQRSGQPEQRQQDGGQAFQEEGMSAMAMAFAMAGADDDLIADADQKARVAKAEEKAQVKADAADKKAQAETAAAEQKAQADTAAVEEQAQAEPAADEQAQAESTADEEQEAPEAEVDVDETSVEEVVAEELVTESDDEPAPEAEEPAETVEVSEKDALQDTVDEESSEG